MAHKSDRLFRRLVAARSVFPKKTMRCFKRVGVTQREFTKLLKTDEKKASKVKRKLLSCITKELRKK